jgi:WD40 repeat protein
MKQNEISASLAYLADAMKTNPANEKAIALTAAELHDFLLPVIVLHHGDSQGHGEVLDASFSPDGSRVVTASADTTAQVWDVETGKPIGDPMKHKSWVRTAEFNQDGTQVVTASYDGTAQLWNAQTGKALLQSPLRPAGSKVYTARFSRDSKRIVTASDDGTAQLWDAQTGKQIGDTMRHDKIAWTAAFDPTGTLVVSASADHTARVWDAQTFQPSGKPMQHGAQVNFASFSPGDRTARVWDARTGLPLGEPMRHSGAVYMARFRKDSSLIVTASFNHTAQIWKWQRTRTLPVMKQPGALIAAFFDVDGRRLATVSKQGVQIWDARTGEAAGPPLVLENRENDMTGASFSSDGEWLLTTTNSTAQVWSAKTENRAGQPIKVSGLVSATFSPHGHLIMTVSNRDVWLWDQQSGKSALSQPIRPGGTLVGASFSPDERTIVTYTYEGTVSLWNAQTGEAIGQRPMRHDGRISAI